MFFYFVRWSWNFRLGSCKSTRTLRNALFNDDSETPIASCVAFTMLYFRLFSSFNFLNSWLNCTLLPVPDTRDVHWASHRNYSIRKTTIIYLQHQNPKEWRRYDGRNMFFWIHVSFHLFLIIIPRDVIDYDSRSPLLGTHRLSIFPSVLWLFLNLLLILLLRSSLHCKPRTFWLMLSHLFWN